MSNEVDQAPELVLGQDDGTFEAWIDYCKHRLYRTEPVGQVVRKTGSDGIVAACGRRSIQVMADCIIQSSECAIVKERSSQRLIPPGAMFGTCNGLQDSL